MSWVAAATAAVGLGTSIYSGIQANKSQKKADEAAKKALASTPVYKPSAASQEMVNDARVAKNALNPALAQMFRQAQQGMANQMGNAQRNAMSGAEALSVGSAAQSNLQSMLPAIAGQQTQYNLANRDMLNRALANMSDEERMAFQSKAAKNSDLLNYYIGMAGAQNANKNQAMMGGLSALMAGMDMYARTKGGGGGLIIPPQQ